jgi:hypothetical protein
MGVIDFVGGQKRSEIDLGVGCAELLGHVGEVEAALRNHALEAINWSLRNVS